MYFRLSIIDPTCRRLVDLIAMLTENGWKLPREKQRGVASAIMPKINSIEPENLEEKYFAKVKIKYAKKI